MPCKTFYKWHLFFTFIHLFIQQHATNCMPKTVLGVAVGHTAVKKIEDVIALLKLQLSKMKRLNQSE